MKTIYTKGNLSYELASSENEYNEFLERMKGWMQELKKRGYGGPLRLDDGIDISLGPELRNNDTYFAEYEGPTINGKGCRFCVPNGTRYVIMPGTLQTDINNIKESKNTKKNTIKLNESQLREIISSVIMESLGKEGIHIKEKNRGKFTATKERTGKSTEELTHSKNPLTRKRANFARMAKRGWKPLKNKD